MRVELCSITNLIEAVAKPEKEKTYNWKLLMLAQDNADDSFSWTGFNALHT